jgi:hypothetical protein
MGDSMSYSPTPVYQFDGYTVRPMTEQDRPYLELQMKADPYHRDEMTADEFMELLPGESAWALEDADGCVVFYFKNSPAVRMRIQFTAIGKRKTMSGLIRGLAWIAAIFRASRFCEILFDTRNPDLEDFAKSRLGFKDAAGLLSLPLSMPNGQDMQPEAVGTVPTDGLRRAG